MQTKKAIEDRRSIRNFKNEDISRDLVEDILNCTRLAPSAKNRQPWYFVILKQGKKNKVADIMLNHSKTKKHIEERKQLNVPSSLKSTANVIKQAPVLILIYRQKDNNWIIGDNLSIGACVENMCLRATELGMGTLWIRDIEYVSKEVSELTGHVDLELNCAVSIGIPNENPRRRPRKKLNDIVEWY